MKVSENELHKLTGKARQTVARACTDLPHEDGPRGARLYDSAKALAVLYAGELAVVQDEKVSLSAARTRESTAKALKTEIEIESLQRKRIPLEVFQHVTDALFGSIANIVKLSPLPEAAKEEIRALLRDAPCKLKW